MKVNLPLLIAVALFTFLVTLAASNVGEQPSGELYKANAVFAFAGILAAFFVLGYITRDESK